MRQFLDIVERYTRMSVDSSSSGVAAVVTAADLLRSRGPEAGIDYFTKLLPEVKDASVQRAIKLQLVELYKASNQRDKALEELKGLITASPATNTKPDVKPR